MPRKRKSGPQIETVALADGSKRYRFRYEAGMKPKRHKVTGEPVLDQHGRQVMMRDTRTATFDTHKEAREALAQIIADKSRGTFVAPTTVTVAEVVTGYLNGRRQLRANTRANYRNAVKPVIERLGHVRVQQLTKVMVDDLVTWMLAEGRRVGARKGKALGPSTVNLMLTVFGMALDDAMKQGLVVRNVVRLVDRAKVQQAEMKTWTAKHAQAFLASVASDRLHAAWMLSLYGLRRGEVLGLRWEDIDLEERTVAIEVTRVLVAGEHAPLHGEPKSARGRRTLPLDEALVAALRKLRVRLAQERLAAGSAYRSDPCAECGGRHVFVDEVGEPIHPESYSDRFEVLTRRAGLPRIRLHDTRHTCATLLHSRGVPIADIAEWLGHAKATFTLVTYTHGQADGKRRASKALTSAYTASTPKQGLTS